MSDIRGEWGILSETFSFDVAGVVAPHRHAADAARDVLIEGGNAIEAAVAAAAVTALVVPHRNGLGGDGSWLIREAGARGRTRVIDARGMAARAATIPYFRDKDHDFVPRHGIDAVLTTPGAIAGWRAALDLAAALGGKMPLARLLEPALNLLREGIPITAAERQALSAAPSDVTDGPGFAATFFDPGKSVPVQGAVRRNAQLGETLGYLAHAGLQDFYDGDVGREIGAELERHEAILCREDFRRCEARWRSPASLRLIKTTIEARVSREGLTLLLALGLFDSLKSVRDEDVSHLHGLAEAIEAAVARVSAAAAAGLPLAALVEAMRFEAEAARLDMRRAGPIVSPPQGADEASISIGVIDGAGLAVSLSQSLGGSFGSGVVLQRTGILLGNRGAGFGLDRAGAVALAPGRRPPLAALPALMVEDTGRITVSGGQAATLAQILVRLRLGVDLAAAVQRPRFARAVEPGGRETLLCMEEGCDGALVAALKAAGHPILEGPLGQTSASALRRGANGRVEIAPDPRADGEAAAGF